jgi:exo-beta-1,3-glucanase (GH17 family)
MDEIRKATGKPVTTAEAIDRYADPVLLNFGDWVFPNAHPYFHDRYDPAPAVRWTQGAFNELERRSNRFVLFKEVGLPTAGAAVGRVSRPSYK